MQILYPYNEILPKKSAHDVFIFQQCSAFARHGWEISLLCGKENSNPSLFEHYQVPFTKRLCVTPLFMLRKNYFLNLSWNFPFFYGCQKLIRQRVPDYVFLSVRKQGVYHLKRKVPNVRYLYEVHELARYPNHKRFNDKDFLEEKFLFSKADLLTTTTHILKEILVSPPYSIKTPIEVIPLAVGAKKLPPPSLSSPITLVYAGQLYKGQGIETLLAAFSKINGICLKIVGGKPEEIRYFSSLAKQLKLEKVEFTGFVPPSQLKTCVEQAHAFVAPFDETGRMPYVAHTKLFEYAEWGRPILAPDLPIVREHFSNKNGALLFTPGNPDSLAQAMEALKEKQVLAELQKGISTHSGSFSWERRVSHYQTVLTRIA